MREPLDFAPRRRMAGLVRRPRGPADLSGTRRTCESNRSAQLSTMHDVRDEGTTEASTSESANPKPPGTG
jgi:hypothetical protein